MSPSYWDVSDACIFHIDGSDYPGFLGNGGRVNYAFGARPVISLKACVKTSGGDGSANTPYTIEETSSGC